MEIETKKIIDDIYLVRIFQRILFLLIIIPLPILAVLLGVQFILMRYGSFFPKQIFNPKILIYPLSLVIGPAVPFTPFLLYVLIKEKRRAWIITFLVIVILPFLLVFLIIYYSISSVPWIIDPSIIYLMIPIYIYCYLLKHTVDEWLREYQAHELRKEQKLEKARRLKDEEGWM